MFLFEISVLANLPPTGTTPWASKKGHNAAIDLFEVILPWDNSEIYFTKYWIFFIIKMKDLCNSSTVT